MDALLFVFAADMEMWLIIYRNIQTPFTQDCFSLQDCIVDLNFVSSSLFFEL